MTDTTDRVMMRLAEKVIWQSDTREHLAAALSSHGLWELVEFSDAVDQAVRQHPNGDIDHDSWDEDAHLEITLTVGELRKNRRALTTLLGEGETLKSEEQADG